MQQWPNGRYILDFDYRSQLEAIRGLLSRNEKADIELSSEINRFENRARQASGEENDFYVDHTVDLMHKATYQDIAHSMAAVGMIAPFLEGIFKDVFERMGQEQPRNDLARKIIATSESIGLARYLPEDIAKTLKALFRYRNEMFHWGFEWPINVRQKFKTATKQWPEDWFDEATMGSESWLFSMLPTFVDHCVESAEVVTRGVWKFLVDKAREENGLPPKEWDSSTDW